ncbi:RNase A-like domain-containing protein [Komagataeibacter sp. FXV3]|uniref:RNase A-like domain-containing protein n=1 Tax=Komagataeibacter sp. FXV3 TaxID=2608998 RepID=UPI001D10DF24|nr:RNase A-like domain-containing protein [Komagataeibacter sp. FXV3]
MGLGAAEMAGAAGLMAAPEPLLSKLGGIALAAHGADMMATGQQAWKNGTEPHTLTERAVHAMALKAHAPPAVADLAGQAADAVIPAGILHAAAHFAATRAIRVATADADRLAFRQDDITTEHFHRPVQRIVQPTRPPANQNLLSPHRQNRLDLNHHEAPPHNRKAGGHVLLKHVDPTDAYIERRFTKENRPVVSFFTSKEEAERAIHAVLRDNSHGIDAWLRDARDGSSVHVEGHLSGSGAIVVENTDRTRKAARHIRVTITKKEHNGMIYYVQTVRLD